jgi:BirA family transcriptional regulator, biotin operon repressor / biotin---[acetyl-CoA-carboxylase] ligase
LRSLADERVSERSDAPATLYDGATGTDLAALLGVPRVELRSTVPSTQDVAHLLAAAGAPAGTLVLADEQQAGRGRHGRAWVSEAGAGIWLTLIERPADSMAIDVLSLRIGLAIARALDAFATDVVRLKWPNDVYTTRGKVAGILCEARWRDGAVEWVAIGVGINVRVPEEAPGAAGLPSATPRLDVLRNVVTRLREAAALHGHLTAAELAEFATRDLAVGRTCLEPVGGKVVGVDAGGELLIDTGSRTVGVRAGSLVLEEETP